ncbi:MAG: hypothetical protein ABR566_17230 [Pyrinomonadaceae bacterium]
METKQPPPDMNIEEAFKEFVEDFGEELVIKLLGDKAKHIYYKINFFG